MHAVVHFLVGVIFVFVLKLNLTLGMIFVLASVLIDVDHVLDLAAPSRRKFTLRSFFVLNEFRKVNYATRQESLHFFHTFEVLVLVFVLSFFYGWIFYVGVAFLVHLFLDGIGNLWNRNFGDRGGKDWIKYWFLVYYVRKWSVFNE